MGFFEDAVVKAKEYYDVAAKKTGEVVSIQKLKFKASQVNSKLSKDFFLGRIYLIYSWFFSMWAFWFDFIGSQ